MYAALVVGAVLVIGLCVFAAIWLAKRTRQSKLKIKAFPHGIEDTRRRLDRLPY